MWFECEQPFLSGERCVTSRKTAAKETSCRLEFLNPSRNRLASKEFFIFVLKQCEANCRRISPSSLSLSSFFEGIEVHPAPKYFFFASLLLFSNQILKFDRLYKLRNLTNLCHTTGGAPRSGASRQVTCKQSSLWRQIKNRPTPLLTRSCTTEMMLSLS